MKFKQEKGPGKCFGSTTVGPKGQVVIPMSARKEMGIEAGNRFLVFAHFSGQGLVMIKAEAMEQLLGLMSRRMKELQKLLKESPPPGEPQEQA